MERTAQQVSSQHIASIWHGCSHWIKQFFRSLERRYKGMTIYETNVCQKETCFVLSGGSQAKDTATSRTCHIKSSRPFTGSTSSCVTLPGLWRTPGLRSSGGTGVLYPGTNGAGTHTKLVTRLRTYTLTHTSSKLWYLIKHRENITVTH
jgi:hypothetical protein